MMAQAPLRVSRSLDGFIAGRHGGVDGRCPDLAALRRTEALQERIGVAESSTTMDRRFRIVG
jgi:hypothetical protein